MSTAASSFSALDNAGVHPEWAAQFKVVQAGKAASTRIIQRSRNDFDFESELGEGSYSTVMLARDNHTSKLYAIKVLDKRYIIKEKKVKYVNIEKDALNKLSKIDKKGIVHLFFTFQDESSLYFVLDYVPNGELLSLIKNYKSLNEKVTKYYAAQLISAIQFMHSQGIIHRDLKPENILLDSNYHIQITDFGTAKLLDFSSSSSSYIDPQNAKSFVGTAEYVAPELLTNSKSTGFPCDIWALGCITYQLLAGKPPFKASNDYQTFQQIMKLKYAFTPGFPTLFRDFVKRILVPIPADRATIEKLKKHLLFNDINWKMENESVWYTPHPEFSPYKVTAKSIKKIPELGPDFIPRMVSTSAKSKKNKQAAEINNSSKSQASLKNLSSSLGVPLQSAAKSAAAALTTTPAKVAAIVPSLQRKHLSSALKKQAPLKMDSTSLLAQIRKNSQVSISSSSNINKSPSGAVRNVSMSTSSSKSSTVTNRPTSTRSPSCDSSRKTSNPSSPITTYSDQVPQLAAFQHKHNNDNANTSTTKQRKKSASALLIPRSLRRSSTQTSTTNDSSIISTAVTSPSSNKGKKESISTKEDGLIRHNYDSNHSFFKSTKLFLFNNGNQKNNNTIADSRRISDIEMLGADIGVVPPKSPSSLSSPKPKRSITNVNPLSSNSEGDDYFGTIGRSASSKINLVSLAGSPASEVSVDLKSPTVPKKIPISLSASIIKSTHHEIMQSTIPSKKATTNSIDTGYRKSQLENKNFSATTKSKNINSANKETLPLLPKSDVAFANFTNFERLIREQNNNEKSINLHAKTVAPSKSTITHNKSHQKQLSGTQPSIGHGKTVHSHSRQSSSSYSSTIHNNKTANKHKHTNSASLSANAAALVAINKLQTGELLTQIPISTASSKHRKSTEFSGTVEAGNIRRRSEDDRRPSRGEDLRMKYHDFENDERRGHFISPNTQHVHNKIESNDKESKGSSWVSKMSGMSRNISG